jgi:hypothetical protein
MTVDYDRILTILDAHTVVRQSALHTLSSDTLGEYSEGEDCTYCYRNIETGVERSRYWLCWYAGNRLYDKRI